MEELRSTDILDKEIHEDARKKAERILISAQEEIEKIISSVPEKLETVKKEKDILYENKRDHYNKDILAKVPLEEKRFLVSFESKAVREAIDNYLSNLSLDKKKKIFGKLLKSYSDALEGKKLKVTVYGFNVEMVKQLVEEEIGKKVLLSCTSVDVCEVCGPSDYIKEMEGFIIETEDRTVRCRVMLLEIVEELIDTYSNELTVTLFGGRLPE